MKIPFIDLIDFVVKCIILIYDIYICIEEDNTYFPARVIFLKAQDTLFARLCFILWPRKPRYVGFAVFQLLCTQG